VQRAIPGTKFLGQIHRVEHHLAHLASCFLVSPFAEAIALSVDGFGISPAPAGGWPRELPLDPGASLVSTFPGRLLPGDDPISGFPNYGDEYKVMGLAAYGEPRFMSRCVRSSACEMTGHLRSISPIFATIAKGRLPVEWRKPPGWYPIQPALESLLGPSRLKDEPLEQHHRDIARSVQVRYEEPSFIC